MNKKGGTIQGFVVILLLCLVALLIAAPAIKNITKKSMDLTDDHIIQKLNSQKEKEQALADKIDAFPEVYLSESISEESIDYGKTFTKFMFEPDEKYDSTKGYLISYRAPPVLENGNWDMMLRSYSKGLAILYTNGVKIEALARPSDKLYYLSYSNVCVVPPEDKGLDAAKIISYATGIKDDKLNKIPSSEEIDKIIRNNRVEQISFTIGQKGHILKHFEGAVMKYFKGKNYYVSKHIFDDGNILAFYKEGTVCFFPTDSSGIKVWKSNYWKSHVAFDSKNGQEILSGDGFLNKKFSENLLNKITDTKKIKR